MTPAEALKQARELLGRVLDYVEPEYNFPENVPVFAEARAFLALPSPVEEGTLRVALERLVRSIDAIQYDLGTQYPELAESWGLAKVALYKAARRDTSKTEEGP